MAEWTIKCTDWGSSKNCTIIVDTSSDKWAGVGRDLKDFMSRQMGDATFTPSNENGLRLESDSGAFQAIFTNLTETSAVGKTGVDKTEHMPAVNWKLESKA